MILKDQTTIWFARRESVPVDGEIQEIFTELRFLTANVQVMSNSMQLKTYGEIKDSVIEIRTDDIPPFRKGDPIYLNEPEPLPDTAGYPDGDYRVDSILPSYVGGFHLKNPTVSSASAVTK